MPKLTEIANWYPDQRRLDWLDRDTLLDRLVLKFPKQCVLEIPLENTNNIKSRSLEKYYHSTVVPVGARCMVVPEWAFHEIMLERHAPREVLIVDGKEKLFIKRSSLEHDPHMDRQEYSDFVKFVILDIEENYGEHVPEPSERE